MKLIGVTGLARSGKDHASDNLARLMRLHKYAFAEPIKTMLKSVFGDHFHEGDRSGICPETCKSYRVMMQTLGTELGREMWNPQVWVNLVARRWKEVERGEHFVPVGHFTENFAVGHTAEGMVLSDVRFDSEAEWITQNGGVLLQVVRPGVDKVGLADHQSELGIHQHFVTHTIVNDGSLFDFEMKLMELVSELMGHA